MNILTSSEYQYFRNLTLEEIINKANVRWAINKDSKYLKNPQLDPNFNPNIDVLIVNTSNLIDKVWFINLDPNILFRGMDEFGTYMNDSRIISILKIWFTDGYIDPPLLRIYGKDESSLKFSDGRHRTIAAYHLKKETIPIAIYKSEMANVRTLMNI